MVQCLAPLFYIILQNFIPSLPHNFSYSFLSSTSPMAIPKTIFIFYTIILMFINVQATMKATTTQPPASRLVRVSCISARYPRLCLHTLSTTTATTPAGIAQAAVSVSLTRVRSTSAFLTHLHSRSRKESGALRDCVEQLSDSVDQLRRTLIELRHLRPGTFRWQMSDVETWVSAALTNEDTCLDGFQGVQGSVKMAVRNKVAKITHMTSNALYLINRLASTRP